jgi:hypothetical protein
LLSNPEVALSLAKDSEEFSQSSIVNDFSVLRLADASGNTVAHKLAENHSAWLQSDAVKSSKVLFLANNNGWTVAHWLAQFQPEWLLSDAAKSPEILRLASNIGYTVAHWLAQYQPEWLQSDAAKSPDILMLTSNIGYTVAHLLAQYQPEWLQSEAATSPEILRLADKQNWSVAYVILIHQSESINHQPLMQKQILTLDYLDCLLAETFTQKFGRKHGLDTSTMAMKLIEQGAAYKHSKPIALKVGYSLLRQCKILIEDNLDEKISRKQLMALHSTIHHNVSKIISTNQHESLQPWKELLVQSENLILQHLNDNPELYDIEHTVDIFCEPADDLLKKIQSERILSVEMGGLESSIASNDVEPIKQAIY